MQRRHCLSALLALPAPWQLSAAAKAPSRPPAPLDLERQTLAETRLADIEKTCGGRLGVQVLDSGSGRAWGHRGDERFLMCSSFKLLAAAQVLDRVARGEESLQRRIPFGPSDLLPNSPVTTRHVRAGSMTLGALCEATMTQSDNAAVQLMLPSLGGPAGLTQWLRSLGDQTTRVDRDEPELNAWDPTRQLDTTTPQAMARTLATLLLGKTLPARQRAQLVTWMKACQTGHKRVRAGLPSTWQAGNKTGTSGRGDVIDLAVVWPPGRAPLVVASFIAESQAPLPVCEAALAQVGRLLPALLA
jgi:beta-lactamase class A